MVNDIATVRPLYCIRLAGGAVAAGARAFELAVTATFNAVIPKVKGVFFMLCFYGLYYNGKELLREVKKQKPQIVLLDIKMPVMDGLESMKLLREKFSKVRVIVITVHYETASIVEYAKLGAFSVLDKDCKESDLVAAIRTVS